MTEIKEAFIKFTASDTDYTHDNQYPGHFVSSGSFKSRIISIIDIPAQAGMCIYDILSNIQLQGSIGIKAVKSFQVLAFAGSVGHIVGYTILRIETRIILIAFNVLGIAIPEIGRYARNVYKHSDKINADLDNWFYLYPKFPEFFKVLELPKNASLSQIKTSYYKLALKYHPDKSANNNHNKMCKIVEAYGALTNNPHSLYGILKSRVFYYGAGLSA